MEEARVAGAALRVEDPELGGASRRAEPVAGDGHLGPLADHIAPQPDPVASRELQAEAGGLGDGGAQPLPDVHGLQDDEQRPGAPREGREPSQPVADLHACDGGVTRLGQVDQQQIDGPCREQRRRERERLLEIRGREDDEPFGADAAGHGLHRVERAGEVQPRDDEPGGLGLRGESQREGRLARRVVALQRDARGPGQPARAEDRVQRGEPGGDDAPVEVLRGRDPRRLLRRIEGTRQRHGRSRERALGRQTQLPTGPRSCRTPARLKRRKSRRDLRRPSHRTSDSRTSVLLGQCRSPLTRP